MLPQSQTIPSAISDNGNTAGRFFQSGISGPLGATRPFLRLANGTFIPIPALAGFEDPLLPVDVEVSGVNNTGDVVGTFQSVGIAGRKAFLYRSGQLANLNTQLGTEASEATGINNAGAIVGARGVSSIGVGAVSGTAFVLLPDGRIIDLGPFRANAISDSGYVAGVTGAEDGSRAFVFRDANGNAAVDPGEFVRLGTHGFVFPNALAVNEAGQAVGVGFDSSNVQHALFWNAPAEDTAPIDLGALGPGGSTARSINDQGQIVGVSAGKAFLYENGQMVDLNTLIAPTAGLTLADAFAINNEGMIVARGRSSNTGVGVILGAGTPGPENRPPVAHAGRDQVIRTNARRVRVRLDGRRSTDPERGPLSYAWRVGNRQVAAGPRPVIVVPRGRFVITLTVTDREGASDTDTVVITIRKR